MFREYKVIHISNGPVSDLKEPVRTLVFRTPEGMKDYTVTEYLEKGRILNHYANEGWQVVSMNTNACFFLLGR